MNFISQVFHYLTTAATWTGSGYTTGLLTDIGNQLWLSGLAVMAAVLVGVGLGAFLGHIGFGGFVVVNGANAARAVPSIALLTLLAIQPFFQRLSQGLFIVGVITMWALAVPPILTNAYVGVRGVEPSARAAAVAMGMLPRQVLWKIELPLALPLIMAGVRTAAVEVVATATLAAYLGVNDLGTPIFTGLALQNGPEEFSGALLVALLALAVDQLLARAGRALEPQQLRTKSGPGRPRPRRWGGRREQTALAPVGQLL